MNKSNGKHLPAVMIAVIVMIAMCGVGSAGYIGVSKNTVPAFEEYRIGDPVTYIMTVELTGTPPAGHTIDVVAYDTYPNGSVERMDCTLKAGEVESVEYIRTYTVAASDIVTGVYMYHGADVILNVFNATGYDPITHDWTGDYATTPCESKIVSNPVAMLDGDDVCLSSPTHFNSTGSYDTDGTIVSYKWDFENDGTYDRVGNYPSTTWHYPAPGTYTAKLTVVDNDGLEDSNTTTVKVYSHPIADAKADGSDGPVNLPVGGGTVTFSGTASGGTSPYTCTWNIPGVGTRTGLGPHSVSISAPTTATLTVVDNHGCTDTDTVRIEVPTTHIPNVPILTPAGMLALIGLLGIVGGSRILRRGRRS